MTTLRHQHNTTFRVDAGGGRYVLRINRPDVHSAASIRSELAWLSALRRDTELGVPEPVPASDGSLTVLAVAPGIPEPRHCVLFRWLDGRFVDDRLTPGYLGRVGGLLHALTAAARRESVAGSIEAAASGQQPTARTPRGA